MPAGRYAKTTLLVYYPIAHLKNDPSGFADLYAMDDQIVSVVDKEPSIRYISSDQQNRVLLFLFPLREDASEAMFRVMGEPKLRAYRVGAEVTSS